MALSVFVWAMIGIALWHFTVFVPDRFWGGIVTISAASPIGQALIGATAGTVVTVDLPNGRSRSVRLADVTNDGVAGPRARAAA